jgi:hypothetical protein
MIFVSNPISDLYMKYVLPRLRDLLCTIIVWPFVVEWASVCSSRLIPGLHVAVP